MSAGTPSGPGSGPGAVAVVLAGGSGARMGGDANKVHLGVGGRTVLERSLAAFEEAASIGQVVLVRRAADAPATERILAGGGLRKLVAVVDGGSTRHASEWAGLRACADLGAGQLGGPAVIAIHDAARPFIRAAAIDELVAAAHRHGGAVPAIPIDAPMLREHDGQLVLVGSGALVRVQTPQAFRAAPLLAAYAAAHEAGFDGVDTASTVERFAPALEVVWVPGDPANLKLTVPADLAEAARLAGDRSR